MSLQLSPQKQYLFDLLKNGEWVCSNAIDPYVLRDHRKRLSEMLREGFIIKSEVCHCERKHRAGVHKYQLVDTPKREVFRIDNDALPPMKDEFGRWHSQPVYRKEVVGYEWIRI